MAGYGAQTQIETPSRPSAFGSWMEKLGLCCHSDVKSIDTAQHPEPVGQTFADLGPPTRASLRVAPEESCHEVHLDRLMPSTIRKSLSYPNFRADSIVSSDGESSQSSPIKDSSSIQRLHNSLLQRLSRGSSSAGSASPLGSKRGIQNNISQESVNRRKELKRALHKRVTQDLLEEQAALWDDSLSESQLLLAATAGPEGDRPPTKAETVLRPRKSSRSASTSLGLPTVAECDDLKPELERVDDDKKSTGRSSWITDMPSSGWVTRKTSQSVLNPSASRRPPNETMPEVPEAGRAEGSLPGSRKADSSDETKGSTNSYAERPHIKRLSTSTHDVIRDVFKPLDGSPRRLGLWLRESIGSIASRPSSLRESQNVPRSTNDPSSSDKSDANEGSRAIPRAHTRDHQPSLDGATDIVQINAIQARNDLPVLTTRQQRQAPINTPLESVRTLVQNVLMTPFVRSSRFRDKDRPIRSSLSLPSSNMNGLQSKPHRLVTSTVSARTHHPAHDSRENSRGLWDGGPALSQHQPPAPIRERGDPFVEPNLSAHDASDQACAELRRTKHQHSSSLQSSTASFRAREIVAVSKRIVSIGNRQPKYRDSKFIEALEGDRDAEPGAPLSPRLDVVSTERILSLDGQIDAADELSPPGPGLQRTRSYTMADFMQSQDNAGRMWERVLQEHAYEIAHKNNETRKASMRSVRPPAFRSGRPPQRSVKGKESVREGRSPKSPRIYDEEISPGASPKRSPDSSSAHSHLAPPPSPLGDFSFSPTPVSEPNSDAALGQILGSADTPESWARFPSHSRDHRNGPAGAADRVNIYDFEGLDVDEPPGPYEQRHNNTRNISSFDRSQLGQPLKSPMVRLPIGILQVMSKFSKGASMELAVRRSARRGIRSSISTGAEVIAPELELLGLTTPALRPFTMSAPEDPDLDRLVPPSPMVGRIRQTDEVGRQLALPVDWNFGRRRSSAHKRPSRSDADEIGPEISFPARNTNEFNAGQDGRTDALTPSARSGPISLFQKPRTARLASSLLSSRPSDEDWLMGRRRSRSLPGVLSDHEIEIKRLSKSGRDTAQLDDATDVPGVASDPTTVGSNSTSLKDAEEGAQSLSRRAAFRL